MHRPNRSKCKDEQGIALLITLGILTVILLIAVAFALSARTEARSGSSFNDIVLARSLAKMAFDRCLMEVIYQGATQPLSGSTNFSNYTSGDLTTYENYASDTTAVWGAGVQGDFVNRDLDPTRSATKDPYWIQVTNSAGAMIGQFAYVGAGSLVDLNAIGNISGPSETYVRGKGLIGDSSPSNYVRGICADVNLQEFLKRLGYGSPNTVDVSAQRILRYRYGWQGVAADPSFTLGAPFLPGDNTADDNGILGNDDAYEYDPVQLKGTVVNQVDHRIGSLSDLDNAPLQIAPDNSNAVLTSYATLSSGDPNLTNAFGVGRVNINSMTNIATFVTMLQQAGFTNNLPQIAVNLLDFRTTNYWPTVYPVGATNYYGVKPTPYLNEFASWYRVRTDTNTGQQKVFLLVTNSVEVWNPYTNSLPYPYFVTITNTIYPYTLTGAGVVYTNATYTFTINFASPFNGYSYVVSNQVPAELVIGVNATSFTTPDTFAFSNVAVCTYGFMNGSTQRVVGSSTIGLSYTNVTTANATITNSLFAGFAVDDPRVPIWTGTNSHSLGLFNAGIANPDDATLRREGTNSFYVKLTNYFSIGEVGYVHRGTPWQTIRLQPAGDGRILDYIRVNDLQEICGRVNINSDTNGPLGDLQSPAFFALFKGMTNIYMPTNTTFEITDAKITNIIAQIGTYRDSLPGQVFSAIGQLCDVTNSSGASAFNTDLSEVAIGYTNDAAREFIIRDVSNLITTRADSGVSEIIAWGRVIRKKTVVATVQIRAKFRKESGRIQITKFQYVQQ